MKLWLGYLTALLLVAQLGRPVAAAVVFAVIGVQLWLVARKHNIFRRPVTRSASDLLR